MLKSFLNKVAGLQACNYNKKRPQLKCFPVNIAKFLRTPILKNTCEELFLNFFAPKGKISALEDT